MLKIDGYLKFDEYISIICKQIIGKETSFVHFHVRLTVMTADQQIW